MYNLAELKMKLQELGIQPKRSLGQNFLVYQQTIEKIVGAALGFGNESLIEIGPGLGALTDLLVHQSKKLCVIELDNRFSELWEQKGVKVIHQDALKVDWQALVTEPTTLVSNLPYQISSSLVVDMSVKKLDINYMVLMFQKEVAQRILSKENTKVYGLLTVIAQTFWDVEFLLEAGPKDFYPPPAIASQVLTFKRKDSKIQNPELYLRLVKASFAQRRKKMINNLMKAMPDTNWPNIWEAKGWDQNLRAETLTTGEFKELYQCIC